MLVGAPKSKWLPCYGHKHYKTGDITVLVCQVILQDYVTTNGSSNIKGGRRLKKLTILANLVTIDTEVLEI